MYELIQAGQDTYYMDCPAKIGLVRTGAGRGVMIDSGLDQDAAKKALRHLEGLGLSLAAVYCTHSHADHMGGCHFLQKRTGCDVILPPGEVCFVEQPLLEPAFLYGGCPPRVLCNKFLLAQSARASALTPERLPEGWEVRFLEGHTFSMALLKTQDDVWFVGDAVASEETLNKYPVSFLVDVGEFLKGLDTVSALTGCLFVPAHAPRLRDPRPAGGGKPSEHPAPHRAAERPLRGEAHL